MIDHDFDSLFSFIVGKNDKYRAILPKKNSIFIN